MPLTQVFVSISDPRSTRQVRHDLSELLTVAVCAVLCSADEFSEIEAWAKERLDWLRGFLVLEHGIPSHDTFGRVFAALDPREFEAAFRRWVSQLIPALDGDTVVAIDGKTSRRSTTKAKARPLHLVSAFAADMGLVLGQTATAEKSNEITAHPGAAGHTCARRLCRHDRRDGCPDQHCTHDPRPWRGLRAVRQGQSPQLVESFLLAQAGVGGEIVPTTTNETCDDGHGRSEIRRCWAFDAVDRLYKADQWADLKSFAIVERERIAAGKHTRERRYYISSLPADAARIARAVRSHWEVENRLHWCLDVQFNEDQSTVRTGFAANNFAIVRHIVMNLLRLNTSRKGSIKTKRMLAATSDKFRAELLG